MPLFQKAPSTPEEIERSKPLDLSPDQVDALDERAWYARAYRGDDVPQLTVRAALMGSGLGFLLAFTNLYIGLKTGWYIGVAITACILSYSIWNTLRGLGIAKSPMSILENNCMQSTASCAGYGTGTTIISAIPAILMLSTTATDPRGHNLPWYVVASWTFVLACLGVLLAIPMKRNLVNRERLRFPEGTAAAVTLHSLYSQGREALLKARALYFAAIVGALTPLLKDLEILRTTDAQGDVTKDTLLPATTNVFDWLPHLRAGGHVWKLSDWNVKLDNSLVLVASGAIMGMRPAASLFLGGSILVLFIGPHAMSEVWTNPLGALVAAVTAPRSAWKEIGIWFGAPLMVSHALVTLLLQGKMILRAFTRLGGKSPSDADESDTKRVEVPISWFAIGGVLASMATVLLAYRYFAIPIHLGIVAVALTFVLTLVAARATGETSVTPVGAMGKLMQLTYGVLMPQNAIANLQTASITANASGSCADLLNDLKSGYLLGANPRRQFVAQCMGIITGTVATTLGYFILVPDATVLTGIDGKDPRFPAPSAQQWKAVADVFKLGIENLHPFARTGIAWGLVFGAILALLEAVSPKYRKWIPSATGVGLGLMLPFYMSLSFFVGAIGAWVFKRINTFNADRYVVPLASGIIAGESIMGVIVAALNNFVL